MSDLTSNIIFRKAEPADKPFIIQCILNAERGTTGPVPWCALFNLTENEFTGILHEILDEEIEGQEWCISQFYIAEIQNKPVAGISAWVENKTEQTSSFLRSNLIYHFISEKKRLDAGHKLVQLSQIRLDRTPAALQLESIYTHPDFRGKGIIRKLIEFIINDFQKKNPLLSTAEILLSEENEPAVNAYSKAGFSVTEWAQYPRGNDEIKSIFPGTSRLKMSLELN